METKRRLLILATALCVGLLLRMVDVWRTDRNQYRGTSCESGFQAVSRLNLITGAREARCVRNP